MIGARKADRTRLQWCIMKGQEVRHGHYLKYRKFNLNLKTKPKNLRG